MKNYILLLFGLCIAFPSFSQVEVGLKAGGAFYFGDLTGESSKNIHTAKGTLGLHGRYHFNPKFSVQLALNSAQVVGTDAHNVNTSTSRNLKFSTYINEISVMPEFNFVNIKIGEEAKFTTYAGTGLSFFHFTPTTSYKSSGYVRLQEIGTEGQGLPGYEEPYSQFSLAIPMTLGVKLALNDFVSLDWTILNNRYTFTDYLDDVSTVYPDFDALRASKGQRAVDLSARAPNKKAGQVRGNADTNDWFGTMTLGVSFNIGAISKKKKESK